MTRLLLIVRKSIFRHRPHFRTFASYYRDIPRNLPAECQLPDTIPYGKRGDRFIHCPDAWR